MKKAIRITLKSGDSIEIYMNDPKCELSIDDKPAFSFTIKNSEVKISKLDKSSDEIESTEEIDYKSFKNNFKSLKKCIDCNGKTYCITGGCANTPCGQICD